MTKVEELISIVQALPQEAIDDLLKQAQTWSRESANATSYVAVKLGGMWQGVSVSEEDIQAVRAEMWSNFGEPYE